MTYIGPETLHYIWRWIADSPKSGPNATLLALLGAAATALVAALGWRTPERQGDTRFALLTGTAAILIAIAAPFALDPWLIAPAWAVLAAALVLLGRWADDRRVEGIAWADRRRDAGHA